MWNWSSVSGTKHAREGFVEIILISICCMKGRFYSVYVTNETVEAVQRALYGEDYSMGALFFASNYSVNAGAWHVSALTRLFEYGGHVYFTF